MRVLEKLLLLVLVLLLGAVGAGAIAVCFMPQQAVFYHTQELLSELLDDRWLVLVGGGVLLLIAILLLFGVVFARANKDGADNRAANVVKVGEGESNVQISASAVDCIIQQQKLSFPALLALESKIVDAEGGAQIILKVTAKAEANMQELAAGLQEAVKAQLQEMVGMKVAVVKVIIAEVTESKPA